MSTKFKYGDRIKNTQGRIGTVKNVTSEHYWILWDNNGSNTEDYHHIYGDEMWELELPKGTQFGFDSCFHEWREYKGFLHDDEYCLKCNQKRPLQNG